MTTDRRTATTTGTAVGAVDPLAALAHEEVRLADQIAFFERELEEVIAAATTTVPDDEHDAEGTTIGFERARIISLLESTRARLAASRDARQRVEAGDYGRCRSCGGPIGAERLAALPSAQTCVDCGQGDTAHPRLTGR